MYGHYLQKKNQNMAVTCISLKKLQEDHPNFMKELQKRWDALEGKRTLKAAADESKVKKQKALDGTTEMTGGTAAVSSFSFETSGESPVAPCPNVARRC